MAKRTNDTMAACPLAKQFKAKLSETNSEPPEEKISTDILKLNDDCLAKIFSHLNENELLNVIRSNTRFKTSCEQAFKRKYCRDPITVSNVRGTCVDIDIGELNHSVSILEHFGHVISRLCIRFKLEKVKNLLKAIVANCHENILEVEFQHLGVRIQRRTTASFYYRVGLNEMRSLLSKLTTQFSNLRHLKFDYCNKRKT